ncbi:MAG: hypothetical protein V4438_04360 [Patescibacteria group bacterium]
MKEETPIDSFAERLNVFWNEHDGDTFYKDELRSFIKEEKSLSYSQGHKSAVEEVRGIWDNLEILLENTLSTEILARSPEDTNIERNIRKPLQNILSLLSHLDEEKCNHMILTPSPEHNGGAWCYENKPCPWHPITKDDNNK